MGIKTKFNPMGGRPSEKGSLSEWRYSTAVNGQITLYEYLGTYSSVKPVYVPMKHGKTVINDYTSGTTPATSNTPFYNNPSAVSVDLQNVPFVNNNMSNAFYNCQNLTSVVGINQNVTNMFYTFYNCYNLNQNIQIPNNVTNMAYTFWNCTNFNQNIQIPSGVTNMAYTFWNCSNLNQNIQIPNSITNMYQTFSFCYSLNQNIQIPNSVTDMPRTFSDCYNLNQNIQIPNSVTDMPHTFYSCTNLNQNIQIPNSVTVMSHTFYNCTNLQGTLTIQSANITNTNYCFYGSGLIKNVIFPSRYIDNTYTPTRNSLATAATGGYAVGTAAGNLVNNTTQNAVFYAYDPVAWEGYNAWVGDGINWRLTKWGGIGNAVGKTCIQVPTSITSYSTFPTMISNTCFDGVLVLDEIDCNHVPIYPAVSTNFFGNIERATGISIYNFNCQGATQLYALTYMSPGIDSFSTGTPQRRTFFINMPNAITNCQALCGHAKGFSNFYIMGNDDLKVYSMFNACNTKDVNVHFTHVNSTNGTNWFRNYSSTYRKNIYLYYTYSNGTATNVYNAYKSNSTYMGTTGNAVTLPSPHYNSTSNFYFYNISEDYCPTNNASWWCCPVNGALKYTGVGYSDDEPITLPTSLSVRQYPDKYVSVTTNTQNMSNMFNGFFKINTPITIPDDVTSMCTTFYNCYNLNQNIQIPNNVTNMYQTFAYCYNLNQNIQIPNNVTNMAYTFYNCTNFNQNIQIPSGVTNMCYAFANCRLNFVEKEITIPIGVTNIVGSFINSSWFVSNLVIPSSVTNLYKTFDNAQIVETNVSIPSSVTSLYMTFANATIVNDCNLPSSIQNMYQAFYNRSAVINVYLPATEVTNAVNCFYTSILTADTNLYIPFQYSNGVNTKTFNAFKSAGYIYTNGVSNYQHYVTVYNIGIV